jgi:hypothetical protein
MDLHDSLQLQTEEPANRAERRYSFASGISLECPHEYTSGLPIGDDEREEAMPCAMNISKGDPA